MSAATVTTQVELDAALADPEITAPRPAPVRQWINAEAFLRAASAQETTTLAKCRMSKPVRS